MAKYGEDFAFLALFIVLSAFRGKGYGKAIWDAGIASAGSRVIGLDEVAIAETLLATLVTPVGTDPVSIDIPEPNRSAVALAQMLGLKPAFETARMYKGGHLACRLRRSLR